MVCLGLSSPSAMAMASLPWPRMKEFGFSQPGFLPPSLVVAGKARRSSDGFWEPKEVMLDKEDLAKLEFSRMLGESREMSIAKVVAKKLNPKATNLEIEKMIKRKGVEAFMDMIVSDVWKQPEQSERKPETKVAETKKRVDPLPLAPKPGTANSRSQASLSSANSDWARKADVSKEKFSRLLDEQLDASIDIRKMKEDVIALAPKPGSSPGKGLQSQSSNMFSRALTSADLTDERLWEAVGDGPKPKSSRPKADPPKVTPELQARPSRGRFDPAPKVADKPVKKEMVVPSLNLKPELRVRSKEPEETGSGTTEPQKLKSIVPPLLKPMALNDQFSSVQERDLPVLAELQKSVEPSGEEMQTIETRSEEDVSVDSRPASIEAATQINPEQSESSSLKTGTVFPHSSRSVAGVQQEAEVESSRVRDSGAKKEGPLPVLNTFSKEEATHKASVGKEVPLPVLNRPIAMLKAEATSSQNHEPTLEVSEPEQAVSNPEIRRPRPVRRNPQYLPEPADQEKIDRSWALAEVALSTKKIQEVLFTGSNAGGMIARFDCLNGFVPGKELSEARGLKTFRSWARDTEQDINHSSILDSSESADSAFASFAVTDQGVSGGNESRAITVHPACETDLHQAYSQLRAEVLSSFVGQKARVVVTSVDREAKKLIFSERKAVAEDSEVSQRRKNLMAKLNVGDVVSGKVRNISLFGVFVELVEGVSGLIHFPELSWSPVSDPTSLVQPGQEIQTKVLRLDRDRERIYLSLKRMSPDPLQETVENLLDREGEFASTVSEKAEETLSNPELEALLTKLEARAEVQEVSMGRYLRSVAVVPNFQVYLSSEDSAGGHKLLARFGNYVQEVLVKTQVDRETMKGILLGATSFVEEP